MVMRLRMPIINTEVAHDIFYFIRNPSLGMIRDEQIHSITFTNVVHKDCGEVSICFYTINVTEMRFSTTEELGCKWTIINGRDISIDIVSGNWFIVMMDIESREWGIVSIKYMSSELSRPHKLLQ